MVNLLNHGHIRLVDSMGDDLSIVRSARVSYDAAWRAGESQGSDVRLLNYLLRNGHTSPFESVTFSFEVKCPMFVARQWQRHRTWSFNEVSARYTELPEEYYVPELDQITTQSTDNKQMRTNEQHPKAVMIRRLLKASNYASFYTYKLMLSMGCPRELARSVLPIGTYTHFFATVDLHNLMHFLRLRLHEHSQYEIRVYAEAILKLIEPVVPETIKIFKDINNIVN